jgi:hypothetical protein
VIDTVQGCMHMHEPACLSVSQRRVLLAYNNALCGGLLYAGELYSMLSFQG